MCAIKFVTCWQVFPRPAPALNGVSVRLNKKKNRQSRLHYITTLIAASKQFKTTLNQSISINLTCCFRVFYVKLLVVSSVKLHRGVAPFACFSCRRSKLESDQSPYTSPSVITSSQVYQIGGDEGCLRSRFLDGSTGWHSCNVTD